MEGFNGRAGRGRNWWGERAWVDRWKSKIGSGTSTDDREARGSTWKCADVSQTLDQSFRAGPSRTKDECNIRHISQELGSMGYC